MIGCIAIAISTCALSATITGTVTEAGTGNPIANAAVAISDERSAGYTLDVATTDTDGNYSFTFTVDPVDPSGTLDGNIVLEVMAPNHAPQRYGDTLGQVDCFWFCEFTDSGYDLVGMFEMVDSDNFVRDFELVPGTRFSGTVTAAGPEGAPGPPLESVPIQVTTDEKYEVMRVFREYPPVTTATTTDINGFYELPYALKPGTYFVGAGSDNFSDGQILPFGNYVSQAYGGFDCEFLNCAIQASTPVVVPGEGNAPLTGIDFALNPGGEIKGRILDALTGDVFTNNQFFIVRVWTPDEGRNLGSFYIQGPDYEYRVQGLNGNYILEIDPASRNNGLLRILNDGTRCPFAGCDRADGKPLRFVPGTPQTIDFSIERGGIIEGTVTDAATGQPIDGKNSAAITIVDSEDRVQGAAQIDGIYRGTPGIIITGDGIWPGDYYVKTGLPFSAKTISSPSNGMDKLYADQLYLGVSCQGLACDLNAEGAVPVTITAGAVTPVQFTLSVGHSISGTVTDSVSNNPIPGRNVEIYTTAGKRVGLERTYSNGEFSTGGLPDGDYRVVVKDGGRVVLGSYGNDGLGYFGQVYGNPANCMQDLCEPGSGTNVTINGSDVTDIDFALNPGPTISGQVIDTQKGLPILLTVDVFNANNQRVGAWTTLASDDASYTTGALLPGEYTLKPRTTASYSLNKASTVAPPVAAQKMAASTSQSVARTANNDAPPGIIRVQLGDSSVEGASMGVLQTVIFGEGGFEEKNR